LPVALVPLVAAAETLPELLLAPDAELELELDAIAAPA
jgi:hypothetical protein